MNYDKLDKVFSEYIRRRYADYRGHVKCCTCPTVKHWKYMDCGHFIRRGKWAVRFHEKNSHAQCPNCNRFHDGMEFEHMLYIRDRYGLETPYLLEELSGRELKIMQHEIDEMVKEYKSKIKSL